MFQWPNLIQPSPATKAYVARVEEVAATKPYLLVAHQYTRYVGDLFGGQMMGGMARRSLDLPDGEGTAFYVFDEIPSAKDFITEWYTRLNGLDLTDEQKVEIVDEANRVFALNIGLFQELEGSAVKGMTLLAFNSLKSKLGYAHLLGLLAVSGIVGVLTLRPGCPSRRMISNCASIGMIQLVWNHVKKSHSN